MTEQNEWKRHEFKQVVIFQPWRWARRWPFYLFIKARSVEFTISFYSRESGEVRMYGVQATEEDTQEVWHGLHNG